MTSSNVIQLQIAGMRCASCVQAIETALKKLPGVELASVNFAEQTAMIQGNVTTETLLDAIANIGYQGTLYKEENNNFAEATKKLFLQALLAALVGAPLFLLGMTSLLPEITLHPLFWSGIGLLTLLIMIFCGGHFYKNAWLAFCNHTATMDTLIALGTGSAWLFSSLVIIFPRFIPSLSAHAYYEASLLIIAFINLGQALEMKAKGDTSQAIKKLLALQPKTATVIKDGKELIIPIASIALNDILRIKPGEKIPLDGIIIERQSTLDESMLTGEPWPIKKNTNDDVIAGTLNKSGSFLMQVTHTVNQTALSQLVTAVKQAQSSKPPIAKLADQLSAYFVPTVIIIAIFTALSWFNFGPSPVAAYMLVCSMTVLVIACLCALGLASPISVMIGIGKAAEVGVLIRNGEALQNAATLSTIVLDKTGTITEGKPTVTTILPNSSYSQNQLLQWAATIEQFSEHTLAQAIAKKAKENHLALLSCTEFIAIPGQGVSAIIDNENTYLGNEKLMEDNGIDPRPFSDTVTVFTEQGDTVVFLAREKIIVGLLTVSDPIKKHAKKAIAKMHQLGLRVILLTGDSEGTAKAIAAQTNIKEFYSRVSPRGKGEKIAQLQQQGEKVAMVGDGINDALALVQSDVGFAIGSGNDIAIESADITLVGGSLWCVVHSIVLSKKTLRNIKQNLLGAFLYNGLGLPIAAGILYPLTGILLSPIIAGAAMALSSLTVVSNANRLRWIRTEEEESCCQ